MLLKDKIAIVTGGTRGIGLATVKLFLDNGAKVALCGSRQETVDQAIAQLREHPDAPVMGLWPDLLDDAAIKEAVAAVVKAWGKVDILLNNAGISHSQPLMDYKAKEFSDIMGINLQSAFHFTQAVVPSMKENGGGVVLNTSSVVSLYGQSSGVGYPASKFAMNGLTKSLARELGPMNIRVNAVLPGVTDTDMVEALPEETKAYLSQIIPLGRIGKPKDVANAFLYLASDLAEYVTGALLSVDGGAMI